MAKFYTELPPVLIDFINKQKVFFVATAADSGTINLSPKGMDSLKVTNPSELVWMNFTGSGNETAAHILKVNRMTIMMCAFEGKPLILRIYGSAEEIKEGDYDFKNYLRIFPQNTGVRQFFKVKVERVQTSCGWGVPIMNYQEDRTKLREWAEQKGEEGLREYWKEKNAVSIDEFPTGI